MKDTWKNPKVVSGVCKGLSVAEVASFSKGAKLVRLGELEACLRTFRETHSESLKEMTPKAVTRVLGRLDVLGARVLLKGSVEIPDPRNKKAKLMLNSLLCSSCSRTTSLSSSMLCPRPAAQSPWSGLPVAHCGKTTSCRQWKPTHR